MMELASVNWEDVILVGTALGIFGAGKAGYKAIRKNGAPRGVCAVHDSMMQLLAERKATADQDRGEIKQRIKELKDESHGNFAILFEKLDDLNNSIKNGHG